MPDEKTIEAYSYYYDHPVEFVQDIIKVKELEKEQIETLQSVVDNNRTAVKSGHGIGKTALEAWALIWFLMTRPMCRVPCTAPTQHQLYDILWAECRKWIQYAKLNNILEWTATKISVRGYENTWFAVARSSKQPENMQGFHEDNILFIIEEASGVEQPIMEVVEGALTNKGAKLLMVGNPTKISGTFYDAFHRDRAEYSTFTYNGENSARVDKGWIKRMARYGTDSNIYRVRVKGEFPKGEPDTFITLDIIEPAIDRQLTDNKFVVRIGVDPAREGDDESVICVAEGLKILPLHAYMNCDGPMLANHVLKIAKDYRTSGYKETINVKVDATGLGTSPLDHLNYLQGLERVKAEEEKEFDINVIPLENGSAATNNDYKNFGSQMWGEMKELLKVCSIPNDLDLIAQLSTRKYTLTDVDKIWLERKKDMKKPPRKLPSPDRADALALCLTENLNFNMSNIEGSIITETRRVF
jgi:phage terminase large subunit